MTRELSDKDFEELAAQLAGGDSGLSRVISEHGMPDFWHRPPGFATLSLFIVEQQVSLDSAKAVFERLHQRVGEVTAHNLLRASLDDLRRCGLTRQKLRYLLDLARQVADGVLDLESLAGLDDAGAREILLSVTGVGPWTADVYLLSALRRPDIWPVGDRALQVGTGE
ncbi:MAG: DNA-3-methyladenine glycosylase 2 family protein, partial [Acidimicrobiia bacterium]